MGLNLAGLTASFGKIAKTKTITKDVALTPEETQAWAEKHQGPRQWVSNGGSNDTGEWVTTPGYWENTGDSTQAWRTIDPPKTKQVSETVDTTSDEWLAATGSNGMTNKSILAKNLGFSGGDEDNWIAGHKSLFDTAVSQNFSASRTDDPNDDNAAFGSAGWLKETTGSSGKDGLDRGSRLTIARALGYSGDAVDSSVDGWLGTGDNRSRYDRAKGALNGDPGGPAPTVGDDASNRARDLQLKAQAGLGYSTINLGDGGLGDWAIGQNALVDEAKKLNTPFDSAAPNEDRASKASRLTQAALMRATIQPMQSGLRNTARRTLSTNSLFGA